MFITTLDFNKVIISPLVTPIERRKFVSGLIISDTSIVALPSQPTSTARTSYTVLLLLLSVTTSAISIVLLQLSSYDTVLTITLTIVITTSVVSCIVVTPTTTMISKSKIKLCVKHSVFKNYFI